MSVLSKLYNNGNSKTNETANNVDSNYMAHVSLCCLQINCFHFSQEILSLLDVSCESSA